MIYHKITIDGLDLIIVRGRQRIQYWKDMGALAQEVARIAIKHPQWSVKFQTVTVPDEASPAKQVIANHQRLHNPHSSWQKCTQDECVKLQIAMAQHIAKKEKVEVVTT